jgi:DNA repair protein RecN (Recombination protein N)
MLQTLYIKNYALIDETRVEFHNGLVTITGETGAGKSILLGALGLIIGNRADTSVLRDKDNKSVVEAMFDIQTLDLQSFFDDHELDYEELCIIRREILPGGKSRAFVNDSPVQLHILKILGDKLVDIHSQHETLQLTDENFQVETLDLFSDNEKLLAEFRMIYSRLKEHKKNLAGIIEKESRIRAEHEFISFQYSELNEAELKEGEQELLESDLTKGENSEEIKSITAEALEEISESENNLLGRVYSVRQSIQKISGYDPGIEEVSKRLLQIYEELKDLALQIDHIASGVDFDPQKKLSIEERLDLIYTLQKKHRTQSTTDLLRLMQEMEAKLELSSGLDETIARLEKDIETDQLTLWKLADLIREKRKQASGKLEKDVLQTLKVLGMPDAKLQVSVQPSVELNKNGADRIQYLFSANKGIPVEEVGKVASGGEISRLMLAIKALISGRKNQPTIIFDEIDAGVSGNIADKLGQVMQRMGQHQQVISITHLPQIASKGNLHIRVEKKEVNKKTVSVLKALDPNERIQELAFMLSGEAITDEAVKNAKVLLGVQ